MTHRCRGNRALPIVFLPSSKLYLPRFISAVIADVKSHVAIDRADTAAVNILGRGLTYCCSPVYRVFGIILPLLAPNKRNSTALVALGRRCARGRPRQDTGGCGCEEGNVNRAQRPEHTYWLSERPWLLASTVRAGSS
ncbi:hypothetical protein J6590_008363 [Homalodisca vitripennis]|nr:hypothetical protein J6590_008363 [Homalodisca vitripennis]